MKVAVMGVLVDAPVLPAAGVVSVTAGGVVSAGALVVKTRFIVSALV